jgi:F0F1-type ATP synthase delta subunit
MENKEKLRQKLRKKRNQRTNVPKTNIDEDILGEPNILKMMENVNKILKTNPQMVQQISKCVSNVMGNKDLMNSLAGQLEKEITLQDQTLESKSEGEQPEAS